MDFDNFIIIKSASIMSALLQIDLNHQGLIFVKDHSDKIIGLATDGDIRRYLLAGGDLQDSIEKCVNRNFIKANESAPREFLLKQLDQNIRMIPILDNNHKLLSILSRDHFPSKEEQKVFARAKSPVRISFGGGGSDTSNYFINHNGAVINATISLFSHASLKKRDDEKIYIHSLDLQDKVTFNNFQDILSYQGKFSLIQSVIKAIHPDFGFELYLHSDFPMNSGLGGSSVVLAAILGCFNQFRNDKWDQHDIAEIAYQAERLFLGVAGGWQDQYATVFGGLNFMEFKQEQNIIHPIRLPNDILLELEESLVLCFTGTTHDSGDIHKDQRLKSKSEDVEKRIQSNVEWTFDMRNHLLRGRLNEFGKSLDMAWQLKRSFSDRISNPWLDEIYAGAMENGAIGGKLLGAGGGGYFLFYAKHFYRHNLMDWIKGKNLEHVPFKFEENGLQSWTVREDNF